MPQELKYTTDTLSLNITGKDLDTICWVGDRYCWSTALGKVFFEEGDQEITLEDATELVSEFRLDMEGGHQAFPCLQRGSSLHIKLIQIIDFVEENSYD